MKSYGAARLQWNRIICVHLHYALLVTYEKRRKKTESRSKKRRRSTHDGDRDKLLCDHDDLTGFGDKKYLCHEYIADFNAIKSNNTPQCCDDCKKIILRG